MLTPHPGEAGLLLGITPPSSTATGSARRARSRASGRVVVLKGAATVMAAPDGRLVVNPTGGPALGSGGTGDVLAGIVGAFLAQGVPAFEAAALAAFVHGAAGDRIAAGRGSRGALASEVADEIPEVLRDAAASRQLRSGARRCASRSRSPAETRAGAGALGAVLDRRAAS